jgi:predicted naringenin-chalcone synthase
VTEAYLNRIATAVPPFDVHDEFVQFYRSQFAADKHNARLFDQMADRVAILHRYSCFNRSPDPLAASLDSSYFYLQGDFPGTAKRMRAFEEHAPPLAAAAVDNLLGPDERQSITHLVVASCTGFFAPGLDFELIERCGLRPSVERTLIGFMGCHAAINALKVARHIVRSEPEAKVLVVAIELSTLHFQETHSLEEILPFLLFADGCAAGLVTSEPTGAELVDFHSVVVPEARDLIQWHIRDAGFDMVLSPQVPGAVRRAIRPHTSEILRNRSVDSIDLWAVHPGGPAVLEAVERAFGLPPAALDTSREVLRDFGNMSSATVLFVLHALLAKAGVRGDGCAMSFGPGMTAETMLFRAVA